MKNTIKSALLVVSLATVGASTGCVSVTSSLPSTNNVTGEAWYTEATGFFGMTWGSKVWYCPAATSPGPTQCSEAKLIPRTKEEVEAEKPKK